VVEYLKMKGVSNKLSAKGYGETQPIADNATEAGKSENRRVELIWVEE
jgi:OOP family OmpA-OmpF porin